MKNFLHVMFFFCFLIGSSLYAEPIVIESDDISVLEHSDVFIDDGAQSSFQNISHMAAFQAYEGNYISEGYVVDKAIWVRFCLKNPTDHPIKRFLHVDNSMLDSLMLYDEKHLIEKNGALDKSAYNGIIDFAFQLTLSPQEAKVFYLRVLSNSSATYFHLTLESEYILWQKTLHRQLILAFFFSVLLTLIIYNAFIFGFTREKVYLYYVFYMFFSFWNHISYTGMSIPIIASWLSQAGIHTWISIDASMAIFYTLIVAIFMLLFVRAFMNLERFKTIDRSFTWLIRLYLGLSILALFTGMLLFDAIIYLSCLQLLYILAIAIYLVYKKEENSLYFLVSWGVNILGTFLFLLYNMGVYIPENGVYYYFYEMSMVFEGLVFSIILSKRLNRTKALAKALETERILIRELHHRVKNNLQFIVSLYRLKLRPSLDEIGKAKLMEAESNVRSIGKIHEILHAHQNISELNASLYIQDLIDEIKRGYPRTHIHITIDVEQVILTIDQAIYCGLIINELVTNALKYAFTANEGEIIIHLGYQEAQGYSLEIYDSGKGFAFDELTHSFGLNLVQRLVKDELKGTLNYTATQGSHYTIRWH